MSKRSNALNVKITVDDLSFHADDTTITIGGVLEALNRPGFSGDRFM
jgi:hypothetical protein